MNGCYVQVLPDGRWRENYAGQGMESLRLNITNLWKEILGASGISGLVSPLGRSIRGTVTALSCHIYMTRKAYERAE